MDDDLVTALTRAVKEEVVENYLLNRRILEEQISEFKERLGKTQRVRELVGKRFLRIFGLLIAPPFIKEFIELIGVERIRPFEFFGSDLQMGRLRLIPASGFTFRSRYRRLLLEAYERLVRWMEKYRQLFDDSWEEGKAVNQNINRFRNEFDLLSILHFLKSLDIAEIERKQFLGGNFSARELASVERKMVFHPISLESLELPMPIDLPSPKEIRKSLVALGDRVFDSYQAKLRNRII